jgi:hypothetical protein
LTNGVLRHIINATINELTATSLNFKTGIIMMNNNTAALTTPYARNGIEFELCDFVQHEANESILMCCPDLINIGLMKGEATSINHLDHTPTGWYSRNLTTNWQSVDAILIFRTNPLVAYRVSSDGKKPMFYINHYAIAHAIDFSVMAAS